MKEMNIFEVATKEKFRFNFRGVISTEALYDLNVKQLDSIFKQLNAEVKQSNEESLLDTKTKADTELEVKIAIVKHIVAEKLEARENALKAKENAEKKQKLLGLLNKKDDEELEKMSRDDIMAELAKLD